MTQSKTQIVGEVINGFPVTGVVTATGFVGDGSQLFGVSGFATAFSSDVTNAGSQVYKTSDSLHVGAGTSVNITSDETSGNLAFTRANGITVATGSTFTIGAGTTLTFNVLGVF
tara:strand:- start:1036 stop:1377 length:342 start_codon:yes stop_codon:yes gene_type:complete